jgi:HSP20 family protein
MVWNIYEEMREMERKMNRLFRDVWGDRRLALPPGETALAPFGEELRAMRPFTDVEETEKEILVNADMPGLDKKDIKIKATEDTLEILAETKIEKKEKEKGRLLTERSYGSYYRSYMLPSKVKPDKITSTYKDGVLSIKMPKSELKKKVEIKVE